MLSLHRHRRHAVLHPSGLPFIPFVPPPLLSTPPTSPPGAAVVWQSIPPLSPEGHAHWASVSMADAWIRDAVARSTPSVQATIDAFPTAAAQEQAVIDLWTSLANVYRALNIPPTIDSNYRSRYFDWIGSAYTPGDHAIDTALAHDIGELYADPLPRTTVCAQRILSITGRTGSLSIKMPVRVNFRQDATLALQCMDSPWTDLCTFASITNGTTTTYPGAGETITANNFPWGSLRVNYVPDPTYGNNMLRAMPPARWLFEMGSLLAGDLAGIGAQNMLRQALANQVLLNIKNAQSQHILPDDLQHQAASLPANFEHMKWQNEQRSTVDGFMTMAATIIRLVPVYGTLVSGIILGVKAVIDAIPSAVGLPTDQWGRGLPVYELSSIDINGLGARPAYGLNGPPGYVEPAPSGPLAAPPAAGTGSTALLAVGAAGVAIYGANALGWIDLAKLFRR